MNYRSAVVFGRGDFLVQDSERLAALQAISDKLLPGRWQDAREPNRQEMKATSVVGVTIESASAKIREGGPIDDPDDWSLPVWSGVLPLVTSRGEAIPDQYSAGIPVPTYLQRQ